MHVLRMGRCGQRNARYFGGRQRAGEAIVRGGRAAVCCFGAKDAETEVEVAAEVEGTEAFDFG
jgi:hypothetical protein